MMFVEVEVVFVGVMFVGVVFEVDVCFWMVLQVFGVVCYDLLEFWFDFGFVEIKVYNVLMQVGVGVQIVQFVFVVVLGRLGYWGLFWLWSGFYFLFFGVGGCVNVEQGDQGDVNGFIYGDVFLNGFEF